MSKRADELVAQIKQLVEELATLSSSTTHSPKQKLSSSKKGAAGAISMLIDEGFFNSPKNLNSILDKLKEIGRYYSKGLVSMNLLNLVKRRILSRHEEGKNKNWHYVFRR
jgi:hypothetical protein